MPVNHDNPAISLVEVLSLSEAVKRSFDLAVERKGKLDETVLGIEGMSGVKYRYFINNLLEMISRPRYLEVGSWGGSTLCAAIFGNTLQALAIDNWSEFGGPVQKFFFNLACCCSASTAVSVLTEDFRVALKDKSHGPFNVYLFDGPHEYQDQYDGLSLALPSLTDEFVFIVDDWNWEKVRNGTHDAILACGLTVRTLIEVRTTDDDSHPVVAGCNSDWHNGYFISVLSKHAA